jgi:Tol biopolymer transport system component
LPLIALATGLYGVRILLKNSRPPFRMVPFTTFKGFEAQPAFSPDGKRIAFSWSDSDQRNADIYVKQIGTDQPLRLTRQPASSVFPVWSPDGRRIAFFRYGGGRRSLYAVPAEGGPETRLQTLNPDWKNAATGFAQTADWSPDGRSLVYADMDSARETVCLYRLSLETMKTARITAPPAGILGDFLPRISFDGTRLAFIRFSSYAACDIRILSFVSNDEKRITLDKKYIVGMSWVPGGREIIVSTKQAGNAQLWRVSVSNGTCRMIMPGEQYAFWIDVSRDGRKMAYEKLIAQQNIYRYDIPAEKNRKATSRHVLAFSHIMGHAYFSPDGRRICFFSDRSGNIELWVCRPDETGLLQLTDMSDAGSGTPRWSPDSQWIAFDSRPGGNGDIYVVGADGGPVKRITDAPSDDRIPSWSGDGKWIYFASNRTGMFQIWKVPVQGGDAVQVTTDGGINGFESSDGRWFYYSKLDTREGIWKLSLKSGKTRLLLGEDMMVFNWALGKNGIYYIKSTTGKNQRLQFFNFSSGRSADIAVLDQRDVIMMGVSPDNRSFLYTNAEYQMDIVLVENFR